jgi:hypothetical protein
MFYLHLSGSPDTSGLFSCELAGFDANFQPEKYNLVLVYTDIDRKIRRVGGSIAFARAVLADKRLSSRSAATSPDHSKNHSI